MLFSFTSFVTRLNLSSFATGSSLWAESSLSVVAIVASLSVSFLGRLSPFVLGPRLFWLLSPLVSGPSGASGDFSSVPFPSEGSTLPTFLPWFPPDPPHASRLCVESFEHLPTPSVLRLWLASLSAAVAPPPEGPFQTGNQSLGRSVLAMVSWRLVPLFRGWFLSSCACASLCLSLFLLGCFVPLYAGCRLLRPPCSLFHLVLRGLLTSFSWGVLSLLVIFLPGFCLLCFLCFGVLPLFPCPWSLSSGLSQAGPLSALAGGLSLGWGTSGSLVSGVFLGDCPVPLSIPGFRAKPQSSVRPLPRSFLLQSLQDFVGSPPAELLLCPFRALRLCFSRLLLLPVLVLSLSLHALLIAPFLRMPSVSSSVMSWLEHFLQLVALSSFCSLLVLLFCLFLFVFSSSFFPLCVWGAWVCGVLVFSAVLL